MTRGHLTLSYVEDAGPARGRIVKQRIRGLSLTWGRIILIIHMRTTLIIKQGIKIALRGLLAINLYYIHY